MLVLCKCLSLYVFFFNFLVFWNIFNSKDIRIYYIIAIHIKIYSMSFYQFILIKIYYICPILFLGKLYLEETPLNLGFFYSTFVF